MSTSVPREGSSARSVSTPRQIHSASKWQETEREDGLTLWELNRPPRTIDKGRKRIKCRAKVLDPYFRCAICLDYVKDTTMVMVCLHRFCGECIQKCVRMGMKECPTCRKPIPSRRSLKRDRSFDIIVKRMIGAKADREKNEDEEQKEKELPVVHLQKAIVEKKKIDQRRQDEDEANLQPTELSHGRPFKANKLRSAATRSISNLDTNRLMEIELRRHPHEVKVDRLSRPFITVRDDTKVSTLKEFLNQKLEKRDYELSSRMDDDSVVLDDDLTLADAKSALLPTGTDVDVIVFKYKTSSNSKES